MAANEGVKASQIKAVTNNGVVYIMGRMTPTQQSNLIDVANTTVGVTELVLLTTIVDDRGVKINDDDIMYENNVADPTSAPAAQEAAVNATPLLVTTFICDALTPSSAATFATTFEVI